MDSEYQQSSQQQQQNDSDQYTHKRKRLTKNQQIYGDFQQAYQPQPQPSIFANKSNSYQYFKAGSTIERYSSQIEVDLPKTKPKVKSKQAYIEQLQEEFDDKPMLGQFTLNSFLNQLGGNYLNDIEQEQNEESSQNMPVGLNDKIMKHLELYKLGQEQTEDIIDIQNLTYERYIKLGKPKPKHQPKYKTQQEKQLAKFYSEGYGVGFKMMQKMGFKNINRGLGKNQTGTNKPVQAVMKTAFTMKDQTQNHKKKKATQSEGEKQEQQTKQVPIPEQLFRYRSKNTKINNFLLDLQRQYQKLNSQTYFLQNEVQSMKNKAEITQSNQVQEEKCASQLKGEIQKLTVISENIQKCQEYPHLGEHYQIDLLYVKRTYQKLKESTLQNILANSQVQIIKLKKALNHFYLAKSKQSLKLFEQKTAIEQKMNKRIKKGHKKEEEVIDLDNLDIYEKLTLTIGVEQEDKIKKFIDLILSKTIIPVIQQHLRKADSLDRLKDTRLIDLIDLVKKLEEKTIFSRTLVKDYIRPCFQNYIRRINWNELQKENCKVYPHLVILPWLHLLKLDQNFSLLPLYKQIAAKIWSIQSGVLYNIFSAFIKFSTKKELNFFVHLYLAPLILNQMEKFSINQQNLNLLQGLSKYCQFLPFEIREQILQNTLFLQIQQAYNKFVKQKQELDVKKWLKNWKKFSDKISPGQFDGYFQQIVNPN